MSKPRIPWGWGIKFRQLLEPLVTYIPFIIPGIETMLEDLETSRDKAPLNSRGNFMSFNSGTNNHPRRKGFLAVAIILDKDSLFLSIKIFMNKFIQLSSHIEEPQYVSWWKGTSTFFFLIKKIIASVYTLTTYPIQFVVSIYINFLTIQPKKVFNSDTEVL